ncbi:hypothetical protein [Brunnivagina elsteri]|uniref:Uncharacterized protein n=1 Tax=Brunnivagina elsteri CCALA 953 TaxID=987040 RepID=A0A2A2TGU5_9CYAN|nr:hypothetical protein [Calothrix elsteri]PAX52848.1 hypothetical protein CK510_17105 [Calothrix elsteri CCALA 953]
MKINIKNSAISRIGNQQRVITALVLSGVLSISSGMTLIKSATALPLNSTVSVTKENIKDKAPTKRLPRQIANAIFKDLSKNQDININDLDVVEYRAKTWRNGCLELAKLGELCTQALVPGWQVTVTNGKQNWIYHTNGNGKNLRISNRNIPNNTTKLPEKVRESVLKRASNFLKLPISELSIIQSEKRDWRNSCLELAEPGRLCSQIIVPGWKVVVGAKEQALVYHTNEKGSVTRLNQKESEIKNQELPEKVRKAVIKAATESSNLPVSELRITEIEKITVDGCLNLAKPGEVCTKIALPAWKVTVKAGKQKLVYHSKEDGSEVRLNTSESNVKLPQNIEEIVLSQASQQSGLPISRLRIVSAERKQWSDTCLGIRKPGVLCAQVIVPGWQVTVSDGRKNWVYRIGESVTVSYDKDASEIPDRGNLNAVPIPTSELPPPLESGIVFRQITSGGILPRTYQTVLLDDGRLISTRIDDANDSERRVFRLSQQQLRDFQKLLEENEKAFQNVNYPPTVGAADYRSYTMTSANGTVQFNDTSGNNLPESLKVVVKAWSDLNINTTR